MRRKLPYLSPALLLVSCVFVGLAKGQLRPSPYYGSQRIARVQYISGELSVAPAETNQWTAARTNQVLTPPEHIWAAQDSRAEIAVGAGYIRMNSEASVTLRALDARTVQIGVNQGQVSLTVVRLYPGEIYEIDTPNATLTVMKAGVYSVTAFPADDQTLVTVRRGSLVATGVGSAVTINSGRQARFRGGKTLQHTAEKAAAPDGFEQWAEVRDQRLGAHPPAVVFGFGPWPVAPAPFPPPAP